MGRPCGCCGGTGQPVARVCCAPWGLPSAMTAEAYFANVGTPGDYESLVLTGTLSYIGRTQVSSSTGRYTWEGTLTGTLSSGTQRTLNMKIECTTIGTGPGNEEAAGLNAIARTDDGGQAGGPFSLVCNPFSAPYPGTANWLLVTYPSDFNWGTFTLA